jgi:phosphoribosyl 1,2-cyclic phosphodiesterase
MWRIKVLASGSKGNSTLVQTEAGAYLVDAGLSGCELERRLGAEGVDISDLSGVVVTHEHIDHVSALNVIAKKSKVKIFCNRGTAYRLQKRISKYAQWNLFQTGSRFLLAGVEIKTHRISHDAEEPIAVVMAYRGFKFGIVTDLGKTTHLDIQELKGVHGILLEANYDLKMLQEDTTRPWEIKQRIMSRFGHLSNDAAKDFVKEITWDGLNRVILGHLSQDCNAPQKALQCVKQGLSDQGNNFTKVDSATQEFGAEAWHAE